MAWSGTADPRHIHVALQAAHRKPLMAVKMSGVLTDENATTLSPHSATHSSFIGLYSPRQTACSARTTYNCVLMCFIDGAKLDIVSNACQSCILKIGNVNKENIQSLKLRSYPIVWVNRLKYLGVFFISSANLELDTGYHPFVGR